MITLLGIAFSIQSTPTYREIIAKVAANQGAVVHAEMISPSVVPIEWKIARRRLVATYPTSVQYYSPGKWTTWMPDRREYAVLKSEDNPVPLGFEGFWPSDQSAPEAGPPTDAIFEKRACLEYPIKVGSQAVSLFVDKKTLLPYGTRAKANGNTYELVYRSIEFRKMSDAELRFDPPADARVAKPGQPMPELIKSGTKLSDFQAMDQSGRRHSLSSLMKGKKGLVLNFWFSSCTGCVAEMPYLVKLQSKLATDKIGIVGVNAIDEKSIIARTSQKNQLPYPTLMGKGAKDLTKQVSVMAYPVTVVLNQDQKVVDAILGFDEPRLTKALGTLGHH